MGVGAAPKPATGTVSNVFANTSTSPNPGTPPTGKNPRPPGAPVPVNPGTQKPYEQASGTINLGGWGAVPNYGGAPAPGGAPSPAPAPALPSQPPQNSPFSLGGGAGAGAGTDWRQQSQDASLAYLKPLQAQRQQALESQLANMGLTRGSAAWNNEMRSLQDQNNRDNLGVFDSARNETALASNMQNLNFNQILGANNQNFNQALASNQYNDNRYSSDRLFDLQDRSQSLNELNALLNGQQVGLPQMPGYTNAGVSQGANLTGAANAQGNWNQQQAANQQSSFGGLLSGAVGLGGAAISNGGWGGLFGFGG